MIQVGDSYPVHRDDVQPVSLEGDEKVVALRRIQETPSLHLARSHVQRGVSDAVDRVVEEAPSRRSVQPVGTPGALLFQVGRAEREGPELLGFLIDERHIAIKTRPYDLKGHRNVPGGGDLRHGIEGPGSSLDDEETSHSSVDLIGHGAVLVGVVPVGSGGMIGRDVDLNRVRRARFHFAQHIIRNAQRRDRQAVRMKIGRVRILGEGTAPLVFRIGGKVVDQIDRQLVARLDDQGRAGN